MSNRPNILFLHSDEHSYRCLSSRPREKGGEPCHTPTLDGLVARGVHFESTYCQMPLCSPSRIAMLGAATARPAAHRSTTARTAPTRTHADADAPRRMPQIRRRKSAWRGSRQGATPIGRREVFTPREQR